MTNDLTTFEAHNPLLPAKTDKHTKSRIKFFTTWQAAQGQPWHKPDLAAYRDHLLERYAPATASAHLSTIRGQYRRILRNNPTRDTLYSLLPEDLSLSDRKATVDEILTRLGNATDPENSRVTMITHQDRPDAAHLRLTRAQAEALLQAPGVGDLMGLRDTAIIALLLCTGIREAELCGLDLPDLRQEMGGELSLHVREGKGKKARLVPYGDLDWCLVIVDRWLAAAGIDSGPVFRGLFRGGRLRDGRLSVRAVQYVVASYPIAINGKPQAPKVHDLRRTYARRQYEAGADPVAIKQNLGHANLKTTLGYIGTLDADKRRPLAVYSYDLGLLAEAPG